MALVALSVGFDSIKRHVVFEFHRAIYTSVVMGNFEKQCQASPWRSACYQERKSSI
jgi:hypothetical protein